MLPYLSRKTNKRLTKNAKLRDPTEATTINNLVRHQNWSQYRGKLREEQRKNVGLLMTCVILIKKDFFAEPEAVQSTADTKVKADDMIN